MSWGGIKYYLEFSKTFLNQYDIKYIVINNYLKPIYKTAFNNNDIKLFKSADLFITQFIQRNDYLNHQNIIDNYIPKECIIITIPHLRFHGYHDIFEGSLTKNYIYGLKINNSIIKLYNDVKGDFNNFKLKFDDVYNNINDDKINIKTKMNEYVLDFKKLVETQSNLEIYPFFENNYKKIRLFCSPYYPTSEFFYNIAKMILAKINIFDINDFKTKPNFTWTHWICAYTPILPIILSKLDKEFPKNNLNNFMYKSKIIRCSSECEYFYKLLYYEEQINKENNKENTK